MSSKRGWSAIALLGGLTACAMPASRALLHPEVPALPASVRVQLVDRGATVVAEVPLERYVEATILSEFAPAAGDLPSVERMYELQAVISRTYAVANLGRHAGQGFDLCSTTHCQLYQPERLLTSRWARAAADAVRRSQGAILWFAGGPASALFHADCGGHTSSDVAVWGGRSLPYLMGAADDGPASAAHAVWRYETTLEAAGRAVASDARTRVAGRFEGLEILSRDDSGRAQRLAVRGAETRVVRGEDLRQVLSRAFGERTIRSTRFDVRRVGGRLVFDGRGFGHGVGLCQAGALARIRAGEPVDAILGHYYPGTALAAGSLK